MRDRWRQEVKTQGFQNLVGLPYCTNLLGGSRILCDGCPNFSVLHKSNGIFCAQGFAKKITLRFGATLSS